jgi:dynactin-4
MAALVRPSVRRPDKERDGRASWDEMKVHAPKATWRQLGVERGFEDVEEARGMQREDVAGLEKRWATAWEPPRKAE